jgi:2-desacetyl-2-hydroxyethyl bacteriochlorophyllide A dehydrogenase
MQSKGIVLRGGKQMELVTTELEAPAGSQVLVRTHAVGLCGSDSGLYLGTYEGPKNYPLYFGHEWSGSVEAVGPDVTRFRPGDKVTGDCSLYCGQCQFCGRDKNLCQQIEKFGITVDGASRQLFLQDERYLYRADPAADLDLVALSEPLAVGAHAARRVHQVRPNLAHEKVLVLGGGAIGLACLFALKVLEGCEHVELYDLVEERVAKAVAAGAARPTDVAGAAGTGAAAGYGGLYSGRGYDAIFETSGSPAAFAGAVNLLRPLGTVMALGFIPSVELGLKQITFKAAQIMGSIGGTGEFDRVLEFVAGYPELAGQLVSHRVPFHEATHAFDLAADRGRSMKVLLQF